MFENDSEVVVEGTEAVEAEEETTSTEPTAREKELEAELAKYKRMSEQKTKKLEKVKNNFNESGDFDYGQEAYLIANGIKGDESDLVKQIMSETGKSLKDVVNSKYFQAELKEKRDAMAMAEAIPQGTKRSGQTTRDQVAYWVSKGELPPNTPENMQLRRDVVNARTKANTDNTRFTTMPVVK
jgi:hypothetical protein